MKNPFRAAFVLFSLVSVSSLSAQAITGRVVDSNGNGVPGVNIDGIDVSDGSTANLSNDGTNAGGFFTTTVDSGAGVYDFTFNPPPPPASTLLIVEVQNVVVVGTTNLGNVVLPTGVSLSGRTENVSGLPVANVDVDVVHQGTNQQVLLQGDITNAFGNFTIAVPTTPIEVRFKTAGIVPTLAPTALQLTLSVNTNLGDITLQPGLSLSGTVQRSGGAAVSGADIDVLLSATGDKLFTPGDNTSATGSFSVVVAAGTYDIEVCPNPANLLVGKELLGVVVSGNTNVGIITLQGGVVLSGTIRDFLSAPVQGADVDVRDSGTGVGVVTCNDNSNASGNYSVVVPTGTFDVIFSPPGPGCSSGLGLDVDLGVVIAGNTVHNGVLPDVPAATASTFAGDGINADTVAAVPAALGTSWTAPLTIGHTHGASGALVLKIRTGTFNGPNIPSSVGGRLTEPLITGPLLATMPGTHNGATGGVAPQPIPANLALAGLGWAGQYTVAGGGFVDLSRAVFGIVGCL
jgi:hypothetical protein